MLDNIGTHPRTDDLRIKKLRPLIPPAILLEEMPVTDDLATSISRHREEIQAILRGDDPRLLVVVGPCSIHDVAAARDYAARLAPLAHELAGSPRLMLKLASSSGSLISPFQPTVVRGFSK